MSAAQKKLRETMRFWALIWKNYSDADAIYLAKQYRDASQQLPCPTLKAISCSVLADLKAYPRREVAK